MNGPYARAARLYWTRGWRPIPLPARQKGPPPHGYTGAEGVMPSYADVMAWTEGDEGDGNIGVRLPSNVIGIDVDGYGGKRGAGTLASAVERWGALPDTPRSTARWADGVSGIRFYRVPDGLRWPGQVGPDIEIIQTRHRYAVVWPSVHPIGELYGWSGDDVPEVDELPELPEAWVGGLTSGVGADPGPKTHMDLEAARSWLNGHGGQMCPGVGRALEAGAAALSDAVGSRHDQAVRAVMRLAHMAAEGHLGVTSALFQLRSVFLGAVTQGEGARTEDTAENEWRRIVEGALAAVNAQPQRDDLEDPCAWQLSGLMPETSRPQVVERATARATAACPQFSRGVEHEAHDWQAPVDGPAQCPGWHEGDVSPWIDVAAMLADGLPDPPKPEILRRKDDNGVFYAGKVNVIFGDPESGKSWLAYAAAVEVMNDGGTAAILDLDHNGVTDIIGRLRLLGADDGVLAKRLRLTEPDDRLMLSAVVADLVDAPPDVVVVDSLGEVLPMLGLSSNSPDDYTTAHRAVLTPLATKGSCVVGIDHLPKDAEARKSGQTGTLAKRRAVSGVTLLVTASEESPFTPGKGGAAHLTIFKDRPGGLRAVSPAGRRAPAGSFVMQPADPQRLDGHLAWWVTTPTDSDRQVEENVPAPMVERALRLDPPPRSVNDLADRGRMSKRDAAKVMRAVRQQNLILIDDDQDQQFRDGTGRP